MPFPADEICILNVNGQLYRDWESVQVRVPAPGEAGVFRSFQFTSSEMMNTTQFTNYASWQIKPGDDVTITLAGIQVFKGKVNIRQVSYDKERHGILIQGRGSTQDLVDSSIKISGGAGGQGGQFRQQPWQSIAQQIVGPYGTSLMPIGMLNNTPFKDAQVMLGESPFNFLERLARPRGILMGENAQGQLVARSIGDAGGNLGTVEEGVNILEARVTFNDISIFSERTQFGQQPGDDQSSGKQASQVAATVSNPNMTRYRPGVDVASSPITQQDAAILAAAQMAKDSSTFIDAEITVRGWQRAPGQLWDPGQQANYVMVKSPMLPLNEPLHLMVATFIQDNFFGSITRLELKRYSNVAASFDGSGAAAGPPSTPPDAPAGAKPGDATVLDPEGGGGAGVPGAGTAL